MKKYIITLIIFILIISAAYFVIQGSNERNNITQNQEEVNTTTENKNTTESKSKAKEITIQSKDKENGVIYSTLNISIPSESVKNYSNLQVSALPATKYDNFLGGVYYIKSESTSLLKPIEVSITYTEKALSLPIIKDFSNSDLTLACWDNDSMKYSPINSDFHKKSKTVSAEINQLCTEGLTLIKKN